MTEVTADNRGPLLNIASWISLSAAALAVVGKIWSKLTVSSLEKDDAVTLVALASAVGGSVAVGYQVDGGLGRHETSVDIEAMLVFDKSTYAGQILYLTTVFLAKSICPMLSLSLARDGKRNFRIKILIVFQLVWLLIALFVVGFQCSLPSPWENNSSRCINQYAFWIADGIVDILTQTLIGILPLYLLYDLHLVRRKWSITLCFASNLLTIPLIFLRLVFFSKTNSSADKTYDSFNLTLVTLLHANISIIAACIPFLKPWMDNLAIGTITNAMHFRLHDAADNNVQYQHGSRKGGGILRKESLLPVLGSGSSKPSAGHESMLPDVLMSSQPGSVPTKREGIEMQTK